MPSKTLAHDEEILRKFCAGFPLKHFKKDRPLFYQGEIPRTAFFVQSGLIKFYNITTGGEEKIVGYEAGDSLLPLEWLFNRSPVALYYYDTFTDCKLYAIPRNELIDFINSNQQLAASLLHRYVSMYIGATMHVHALEQSKARDKLLHILQYLVLRFGHPVGAKQFRIELRLTHQDIANLIGITRETVAMEVNKLKKAGIIKSENLHYIIDTDRALRVLGDDEFNALIL